MIWVPMLTPATIDALRLGRIRDPGTIGLHIEVLPSGTKWWKYHRLLPASAAIVMHLGCFPTYSIAEACACADGFNEQIEVAIVQSGALRLRRHFLVGIHPPNVGVDFQSHLTKNISASLISDRLRQTTALVRPLAHVGDRVVAHAVSMHAY